MGPECYFQLASGVSLRPEEGRVEELNDRRLPDEEPWVEGYFDSDEEEVAQRTLMRVERKGRKESAPVYLK